jgi:hypothetical protein
MLDRAGFMLWLGFDPRRTPPTPMNRSNPTSVGVRSASDRNRRQASDLELAIGRGAGLPRPFAPSRPLKPTSRHFAADQQDLDRRIAETAARRADLDRAHRRRRTIGDDRSVERAGCRAVVADLAPCRACRSARRLQRIGRDPPPALLVSPEDALSSVRSAILLGAVVPEIRAETEALAGDLKELAALRQAIARSGVRLPCALDRKRSRRKAAR